MDYFDNYSLKSEAAYGDDSDDDDDSDGGT